MVQRKITLQQVVEVEGRPNIVCRAMVSHDYLQMMHLKFLCMIPGDGYVEIA